MAFNDCFARLKATGSRGTWIAAGVGVAVRVGTEAGLGPDRDLESGPVTNLFGFSFGHNHNAKLNKKKQKIKKKCGTKNKK